MKGDPLRRLLTLAVASIVALGTLSGTAYAPPLPSKCHSAPNAGSPGQVSSNTVRFGAVQSYKVTTTAAQTTIGVWSPGDIDLGVCKAGGAPVCTSTNPAGAIDFCQVGPGTWIVMVAHCTDPDCGYDPAGAGAVKVDLPYVLFWG